MLRTLFKSTVDKAIYFFCRRYRLLPRQAKTILIFRKDGMGDYIIFYPFLRHFREYFKGYRFTFVVPKVAMGLAPVIKEFGDIIEYDTKKFSGSLWYRYAFIRHLAKSRFEVAVYPVRNRELIGDMIMELTGAAKKISSAPDNAFIEPASEIEWNRYFTSKATGLNDEVTFPTMNLASFDGAEFEALAEKHSLLSKKYCVIFPGTGAEYKRWPEERFAAVCDYLVDKGIVPVIAGAPSDVSRAKMIVSQAVRKEDMINIAGETSIATLAHLLTHSLLYFGNDTGVLHLAAALDVPAISIMGGGHFGRFFPYGNLERNRIIFDPNMTCKNDEWRCAENLPRGKSAPCIEAISTLQAITEIDSLIKYLK